MPNLLFCMTPGIRLNDWEKIGSLNRELKPYVEYVRRGWKVKILTFDKGDIPALPKGIEAVRFPYHHRLLWLLPWTHKELGKWADVIKTNQANHAYFYTRAAVKWMKPILLRCGYVHGAYLETTAGLTPKVRLYQWMEAKAFQQATYCQIPTKELSEWVQRKYRIPENKISVVPNFVDTNLFKPMSGVERLTNSVISVGRLDRVKQFDLLIKACAAIPNCTLTIVGGGLERDKLVSLGRSVNLKLTLPGNIPNEQLPEILNQHHIFAITSKWEGHPKALIEAMACGMACLGVEAPGITNVMQHGQDGLIVRTEIASLKNELSSLLSREELAEELGRVARETVEQKYSLSACFAKELATVSALSTKT
ncbi:MAG: glycosyltransferase family 4 protein [Cyanobacteriota bacterium]